MAGRDEIVQFCSAKLDAASYQDVAFNGLQIEGKPQIQRLTVAVSCNQSSIDAAIQQNADALLVHHGLILDGRVGPIQGPTMRRLHALLSNEINLIAYHLPLDGHPGIGNNACLIANLGLQLAEPLDSFGPMPIGYIGSTGAARRLRELVEQVAMLTEQEPVVLPGGPDNLERVAVMSGSGYPAIDEAAARGCDALLTGDVREQTMATARELGITVIAAGHEATERLGVQALANALMEQFDVQYEYWHDPNPI